MHEPVTFEQARDRVLDSLPDNSLPKDLFDDPKEVELIHLPIALGYIKGFQDSIDKDVGEIRASSRGDVSLAKKYGIDRSTIRRVRGGVSWSHI